MRYVVTEQEHKGTCYRLWLLSVYLVMILVAVVLTHTILWKGDGCIIMGNAKICVQVEKFFDKNIPRWKNLLIKNIAMWKNLLIKIFPGGKIC